MSEETFGQLLARVSDNDILRVCREIDEDNSDGYTAVLPMIRQITPSDTDIRIILHPDEDDASWIYVSGEKMVDHEGAWYAIEFTPWSEWLSMPYRVENCDLTEAQIVAWCVWEMTWAGWSPEDIEEKNNDLREKVAEIKDTYELDE